MLFQTYLLHDCLFHFQSVLFLSHIYPFSYGLTCFMASSSIFNLFSSSFTFILSLAVLPVSWLLLPLSIFLSHIYSLSHSLTCFMASSSIFNLFSSSLTFILSLKVLPVSWLHLPFSICSLRLVSFVLVLSLPLSSFLLLTELDAIIVTQGFLLFFLL